MIDLTKAGFQHANPNFGNKFTKVFFWDYVTLKDGTRFPRMRHTLMAKNQEDLNTMIQDFLKNNPKCIAN